MSGRAYYNDNDPFICAWARELIKAGLVMDGEVDERPIQEVEPTDLAGFVRCHFFCGILGWDHALNLAGWGDEPVWTGSCPCQPFSSAGRGEGFDDARHLWPEWFRLIRECRPPVCFGEQVSSPAGLQWLDVVSADLEAQGYAVGAADLGAAGVGAPHIRQRLWFVADTDGQRARQQAQELRAREPQLRRSGAVGILADPERAGRQPIPHGSGSTAAGVGAAREGLESRQHGNGVDRLADSLPAGRPERGSGAGRGSAAGDGKSGILADTSSPEWNGRSAEGREAGILLHASQCGGLGVLAHANGQRCGESGCDERTARLFGEAGEPDRLAHAHGGHAGGRGAAGSAGEPGLSSGPGADGRSSLDAASPLGGFWADANWLPCRDGKARPTKPGIQPLAARLPGRVGMLRGAGNSIVPQAAAEFIQAYREARGMM